jgi:hypothetical protein
MTVLGRGRSLVGHAAGPRWRRPGAHRRDGDGDGRLRACAEALRTALHDALGVSYNALYGASACDQGDPQWCHDAIRHTQIGGLGQPPIEWQNRPTFQQVVEVQGHR